MFSLAKIDNGHKPSMLAKNPYLSKSRGCKDKLIPVYLVSNS